MKETKHILPLMIVLTVAVVLASLYLGGMFYFENHFLPRTSVNSQNVSFKSLEDAEALLSTEGLGVSVIQKGTDGKPVIELIDLTKEAGGELSYDLGEQLRSQNNQLWFTSFFQPNELKSEKVKGTYDETKLKEAVKKLYCLQEANIIAPEDAKIGFVNNELTIVPAVDGTTVSPTIVENRILSAAKFYVQGENTNIVDLTDEYETAKVRENDEGLKKQLEELRPILSKTITINITSSQREVLSGNSLSDLFTFEDNTYKINETKLDSYIASIASKYNVSSAEYIDSSSLRAALIRYLPSKQDASINVSWIQESKGLIVVSYSQQKLWYYENGDILLTSDIVTGNAATGTLIPYDTYYVRRMKQGATLSGSNYTEYVDYWIGFDDVQGNWRGGGVIGFHDASWRNGQFGGDIWLSDPSHGCINMPTDKVAALYDLVDIGTEIHIQE